VESIQILIAKLKEKNIGVLITDHNANETLSITDRVYIQFDGQPFRNGTSEQVANDDEVKSRYFGRHYEYKKKIFTAEDLEE
ncbi:MAG: LPS export ABC transporter ATP-binding protein, partial [Bacteroidota bacterium]